jgi:hypothetical protein
LTGTITAGDPTQTARLFRDGIASTCADEGPNPGPTSSGPHHYDEYGLTNTGAVSACVTVNQTVDMATCTGTNFVFVAAYSPSFNPADVAQNWIADGGTSPNPTGPFSFDVPAGANFRLVVSEVTPDAGCGGYTLDVTSTGPTASQGPLGLTAQRAAAGVTLRWHTAANVNTLGFNVYRERGGKRIRLNAHLVAAPPAGATRLYTWIDRAAPRSAVRYWLQEVGVSGLRIWHGPAIAVRAS